MRSAARSRRRISTAAIATDARSSIQKTECAGSGESWLLLPVCTPLEYGGGQGVEEAQLIVAIGDGQGAVSSRGRERGTLNRLPRGQARLSSGWIEATPRVVGMPAFPRSGSRSPT